MKINSKTPYIIVRDYLGYPFLIPANEKEMFYIWSEQIENGFTSEYEYNHCRVDLSKLRIYSWEE